MEQKLLFLCTLVVLSQAAKLPTPGRPTCSRQCTETNKFGYETGKTYEYDYASKVSTSIHGASEDKAEIDMTAKVHIEVQSKCDLVLKISNVELKESDPKSPKTQRNADASGEFRMSLEKYPLMFAFQDGFVEELCPSENEQTWALNIKRAIISAFQNSMDDFSHGQKVNEVDVTGKCDVTYTAATSGWTSMTITKTKDTLGCVDRHGYKTAMQGTPYRVPSEIQSLPLVKSTHECQQGISKAGILQSSSCSEQHILRPFSRESSGAVTDTTQILKYVTERQSTPSIVSVGKKTALTFEHDFGHTTGENTEKAVISKLEEICKSSMESVKPSTARQFTELVKLMKTLDGSNMENVHNKVHSGKICPNNPKIKKFFLDAIPMVGTQASLRMMANMINGDEVTGPESDLWLTSLAFIKNPTKDMLMELKPLLTNTKNGKAMLAVSSLINSYCKTAPCANDIDMVNLVSSFESKISVGCFADKNNVNNIIHTLRAFGNAGFSSSVPVINSCLTRKENPTEVRLAAAQAFRRMPCDANRNDLMTLYSNRDEDSELRIAAYLGLMSCPSLDILEKVRNALETEEVNQVGSFVWSHLTNLMETSSPLKQNIKSILSNRMLKKEFNLEKMKYSRNYEASFFLEKINTGAALDSNLVWSSKSFLPRSAMTNLTIDLFGHSVNIFEVGGRIEGLEYFLESYFGPEGYFGKSKDPIKQSVKGISNKAMDKVNEEFGSTMEELKGSMYLRIFGNELQYINSDDIKSLIEGKNFNILDLIIDLSKDQDYTFTQSVMFLDTTVVIPTISGFPLNISVDGSATINLQASGKMDLRQFSAKSVSIEGKIKPSGAVEISSMVSIDAFVTKAGMKMVSSLNSATALEGHIQMKEGHIFSAEWKTPEKKMDIFDVRTSFFTVHRDETREQKMITKNRQTKKICTGDKLSTIAGFELCGEISYPNASLKTDAPYFPLTGPVLAGVTMYKTDNHKSYKMDYAFSKTKTSIFANVAINTPGSKIDREMKVLFDFNTRNKEIEMMMLSPWKKATLNGKIDTGKEEINGKVVIDETEYSMKAALSKKKKSSTWTYIPSLEIIIPQKDNIKMDGIVTYDAGKIMDAGVTISGISKEPVNMKLTLLSKKIMKSVKGSIAFNKKEEYSFETRMQTLSTKKSTKFSPFVSIRTPQKQDVGLGGSVEIKYKKAFNVDLTVTGITRSPMKYFVNLRDTGNAKQSRYQARMNIQTPMLTTKGRSNIVIKSTSVITRSTMDYIIPRVSRDKITMNSKIIMRQNKKMMSVKGNGVLNFKKNSHLNLNIGGDFLNNAKLTKTNLDVQYGADKKNLNKKISFSSVVKHKLAWRASDISLTGQLEHLESGIDMKVKGSHSHNKKALDTTLTMSFGKAHSLTTSIFLKDKSKKMMSISGGAELSLNGNAVTISNSLVQQNNQKYSNNFIAKLGKQKLVLSSDLKRLSNKEYELTNDITLPEMKPYTLKGQVKADPNDFRLAAEIGKNYAVAVTSLYKPQTMISISGDLKVDTRHLVGLVEAQRSSPKFSGKFDVKWDADRDASKRIKLEGEVNCSSAKDITAKFEVDNPVRNVLINYNHNMDKSKQLHLDLAVAGRQQIVLDGNLDNKGTGQSGLIRLQTPLKNFNLMEMNYQMASSDKEYTNNFAFSSTKSNKIEVSVNVNKPISLNKFQGTLKVKTPFKGYESSSLEINHEAIDQLKSMLKTDCNNKKVQINLDFVNNGKEGLQDLSGVIRIKTSMPNLKGASLNLYHKSNGRKYQNAIVMELNDNVYKYEGQMDHVSNKKGIKNTGNLMLLVPSINYHSDWDYSRNTNEIDATITSKVNGKRYKVELNGRQAMSLKQGGLSVGLKLNSPSWNDVQVIINHQHKPSLLDSTITVSSDGKTLSSLIVNFNMENGKVITKKSFKMAETILEMSTTIAYESFPISGQMLMKYNSKEVDITGSYDRKHNSQNGQLKINSPFAKDLSLNMDQSYDGEQVLSSSFKYGKTEIMAFENRFRWDNTKMIKTSVVLPFDNVRKFEYSLHLTGDMSVLRAMSSLEVEPSLKKITISSEWNSLNGLNGKIRLDTPFKEVPFSQITMVSKPSSAFTTSNVIIEYLPTKEINLQTTYRIQKNLLEVNMDLKTPFNGLRTMSGSLEHSFSKDGIKSLVKYTCPQGTLYSADASLHHSSKKEGSINIQWNQKKIHASAIHEVKSGYPVVILTISTPFSEEITVDVRQNKVNSIIVTSGLVKYSKGKKMSLENRFQYDDAFVFTTSIETPYDSMRRVESVLEGKGDLKSFTFLGSIDIEPITKKYLISGAFNTDGGIDGSIRVETPFESVPYSQISISNQQTGESTKSVVNIEYLPSRFITVKTNHVYQPDHLHGSIEIQTPFTMLQYGSTSMTWKNNGQEVVSQAKLEYPKGNVFSVDSSVKNGAQKEVFVEVESPYHKAVSVLLSHKGQYPALETHGEVKYQGNKKHVLDFSFNKKANFNSELSYKGPFTDKMSLEVGHKGDKKQFNAFIKAQLTKGQLHHITIVFKNLAKIQGTLTVKSPFIDDLKASFHHSGSLKNLKSHVEYAYGKMKPASADIALITGKRIQGSVKLSSPMFDDVTMILKHKGTLSSFRNKINIMYSNKQKISTDLNFRLAKVMKATFIFVSPFKGFKKVVANVKHEGSWESFKCDANIKRGKEVFKANMKSSIGSKFNWQAAVETPIVGWKKINAAISHEGRLTDFKCHAEIARGKQEKMSGDIKFIVKPSIDILVAAETPFQGLKNVKASLAHQSSNKKIQTHAEVTYFKKDTVALDFLVDKQTQNADIQITTPWKGFEKMSGSIAHSGSMSKFDTRVELSASKTNTFRTDAKFNSEGQIAAELKISTPFKDYESTLISFTHSGSLNNFRSKSNILFNKKENVADVVFNTLTGIEAQFTLQSPYINTIKANILHKNERNMRSAMDISYGTTRIADASLQFKHAPTTTGSILLKLINVPKIEASVEHEGSMFNNKAKLQASYGKDMIVLDSLMQTTPDISGKIQLSTPFKSAESLYLSYTKSGSMNNLNARFETGINQEKITLDATLSADDVTTSTLSLITPFNILRNAEISTRFSGVMSNFDSHTEVKVNEKMTEADITVITGDRVDIRGSFKSPFSQDIIFKLNHDGTKKSFKSSSELSYGYKKVFGEITTDFTNGIQVDALVQTPFSKDIVLTTSTNNDFGNLKSLSHLSYMGKKQHEIEVTLSLLPGPNSLKLAGQASYNGKDVSGNFDLNGKPTSFQSKLGMQYNKKHIIAELSFDSTRNVEGMLSVKTPITPDFDLSFKHEGTMFIFTSIAKMTCGQHNHAFKMSFNHNRSVRKFTTYGDLSYNGQKIIADISLDASKDVEGRAMLKIPQMDEMVIAFSKEGTFKDLKTCLKVTYSGRLQHDVIFELDFTGSLDKFVSKGSLTYNGQMASSEISLDVSKDIEGKLTVRTPISKDFIFHFSNEGSYRDFKTCLKITYSGLLQHDASLKFDISGEMKNFVSKVAFAYNGKMTSAAITLDATEDLEGKLTIKTPVSEDFIFHFSNEGSYRDLKTCLKITYSGRLQHDASFKFDISGPIENFVTIAVLTYNEQMVSGEINLDTSKDIEGKLTIKTPVAEDFIFHFSNEGSYRDLKTCLKITYSGRLQHDASFKFNFQGPINNFVSKAVLTYNGKITSTEMTLDASNDIEGKLTVKSPFSDDFIFHFSNEGSYKNFKSCLKITYSKSLQHDASISSNIKGSLRKFSLNIDAVYNGKQISTDALFDSQTSINGQISVRTPWTKTLKTSFAYQGNHPFSFHSELKIVFGRPIMTATLDTTTKSNGYGFNLDLSCNEKKITAKAMVDIADQNRATLTFNSPYTDEIEVVTTAQANRHMMGGSVEVKVAGNIVHDSSVSIARKTSQNQHFINFDGKYNSENINGKMSLVTFNGIDAKMTLDTPFMENMDASFVYEANDETITVNANGKLGSANIEFSTVVDKISPFSIRCNLKTPIEGMKHVSFNTDFNNNPVNFRLTADLSMESKMLLDLTIEHILSANQIQGNMIVKTNILEDINIKYDISGNLMHSSFSLNAALGIDNYIKVNSVTSLTNVQSELRSTVDFNVAGISKTGDIRISGQSGDNDLRLKFVGKIDDDAVTIETLYKYRPSYEISVTVETPFQMAKSSVDLKYLRKNNLMKISAITSLTPANTYEFNVDILNKNYQKVEVRAEVKTPIQGHELMKWIYKHEMDKTFSLFTDYSCSSGVQMTADIKLSPQSFIVEIKTPFALIGTLSFNGKLENQNSIYGLETEMMIKKQTFKLSGLVDLQNRPMTTKIQLTTPFNGLESSEINLSCTGNIRDLRATADLTTPFMKPVNSELRFRYASLSEMEGKVVFTSGMKNLENLRFSIVNQKNENEHQTHLETAWRDGAVISVAASCDVSGVLNGNQIKTSISISTPFKSLKTFTVNIGNKYSTDSYTQSILIEHNSQRLLDVDMSYSKADQHTLSLVTRHPRPMSMRIGGFMDTTRMNTDISLNWDTDNANSNINMESYYNHNENKCNLVLKLVHPSKTVEFVGELGHTSHQKIISFDISADSKNLFGYHYDCQHKPDNKETSLKIRLPSRSFMVSNQVKTRLGAKMGSSSFYWDADRDQTKKVTVKGDITPNNDGIDANVVLEMPTIGQDIKIDSKVQFNKGSVLFDGKTELRYSRDERKTLVLSSRLEDLSSGTDTNYSFNIGVKHPYTTVGVELVSHIETSDNKKMASVDVKYQTVDRINRNFGLMGEIDSLKNSLKVELASPIKAINVQGMIKTTAPYKVAIKNMYDNSKTINGEVVVNPSDLSIDANINYDIENPQNILHLNAMFAGESGLTAEVFRNIGSQRISDTLINLRLKTAKILHTRVHWNPQLLNTVKSAGMKKIQRYGDGIDNALQTIWKATEQEMQSKHQLIISALVEDMKPYINFLSARVTDLQRMERRNDFYLHDMMTHFKTTNKVIRDQVTNLQKKLNSLTQDFDMTTYNLYLAEITNLIKTLEDLSMRHYAEIMNLLENQSVLLSHTIERVYTKYGRRVTDTLSAVSTNKVVEAIQSRIPRISQISENYNTAIYNTRETINTGLIKVLPTPVYHMAFSAYKYWEIEENIKSSFQKFFNFIKKDIEEEFTNVKDIITDLKKTKVTVYDPKKGHFEMDIYLPLEMKSLTEIKHISNPLDNLRSYIPTSIPLPSWSELWSHTVMPTFGAHAYIHGNHFTTFDGHAYDFNGKCSYILARDFGKDKFSIIMNYMARQNKKMIVLTPTQNVQVYPNGKVRVDGVETTLPYASNEIAVSQSGHNIYIDGQGFNLVNNIKNDSYDIEISHWFHGRTAGLLGIHDNERYNDMMTSDRQITRDPYTLANTWQVQDKCT